MALEITAARYAPAGAQPGVHIDIRGNTSDEVNGALARQMTEIRAKQELRTETVYLAELQPPAIPLDADGRPVQSAEQKTVAYGAIFRYST